MKTIFIAFFLTIFSGLAQDLKISGIVLDKLTNTPLPFVNISIIGEGTGTSTDELGYFEINNLKPGVYNLQASFIGYKKRILYEIELTNSREVYKKILLEEGSNYLEEVGVSAREFSPDETPISFKAIGVSEIKRNPGGNRDISKVMQTFPGVATSISFRNDIIIRGGSPNENVFYLDGIEVPNINHFSTQGSSGGPVGLINVDLIENVDFISASFPSNRGNTLSSIFEFTQKRPNKEKFNTSIALGSSDLALLIDGPISKNSGFILSARRSYLQFLFKALQLPFLPEYNDIQFKYLNKFSDKSELTIIGLAAIDDFSLNKQANDGVEDITTIERNRYILDYIPIQKQWNYTLGANYKYFSDKGFHTFVLSRSHLNNNAVKNDLETNEIELDYLSEEIENKFRYEYNYGYKKSEINLGFGIENALYTNDTYKPVILPSMGVNGDSIFIYEYNSDLNFEKFNLFSQFTTNFLNERLITSIGLRTDFNNYSNINLNPLSQFSPRISVAYFLNSNFKYSINTGVYYQLPPYTVLGYRDDTGALINKENDVTYIQSKQIVTGFEYVTDSNTKITLEGFYKHYSNYPFLIPDSVSLANLGADFGVIGDQEIVSNSSGRAYGIEFFAQRKLTDGIYGLLSYTLSWSQFKDKNLNYIPSSWDQRHIINICAAKKFKKNWEVGFKWRYTSANPYTPYDEGSSMNTVYWDLVGQGLLDYENLNSERNKPFHHLDIRIDKKYYFKNWSLNFYLDLENLYNKVAYLSPYLTVERNESGTAIPDSNNPGFYSPKYIDNTQGQFLPSIGLIVEF
tara:strand:+ start:1176 stop:3578 length:2403 start_codon:yes stop_codon:yes gene_type:complete